MPPFQYATSPYRAGYEALAMARCLSIATSVATLCTRYWEKDDRANQAEHTVEKKSTYEIIKLLHKHQYQL
jgi:hypothetical protein